MKKIIATVLLMYPFLLDNKMEPLTIIDQDQVVAIIERDELRMDLFYPPFLNELKLQSIYEQLYEVIYKEPVNARFDQHGQIIKERSGITLHREKLYMALLQYYFENEPTTIRVPKMVIYPRVDSELLVKISEKKLNEYTTFYRESNRERSHNIFLSTEAINNHVIFPGETFSFNEVVGERTKERGYLKAPVIVKGEFTEDIGGGICQVSSTLYNAVDLQQYIEIVERYSHSRTVPYVPPGRDATVSWWGPDFVFKNNHHHPILIRATAKHGAISIQIYSTED